MFEQGQPQTYHHISFQPALNNTPYRVKEVGEGGEAVTLGASFTLSNYKGSRFDLEVDRRISILDGFPQWLENESLDRPAASIRSSNCPCC